MLHSLNTDIQAPERFTYPFCYEPHPLCEMAAKEVQAYIGSHAEIREDADKGKMFGVLVVKMDDGRGLMEEEPAYGFLAAYSGLLAGRRNGRSLSFLITRLSSLRKCRRTCSCGCSINTSC